jgi:hypothetical protein
MDITSVVEESALRGAQSTLFNYCILKYRRGNGGLPQDEISIKKQA